MGMSADHWVAHHDGHKIEVEAYSAGFFSGGCALFVDDVRVDSVPSFKITSSAFTLRHRLRNSVQDRIVSVQFSQHLFRTVAELWVDEKPVQIRKLS